MILSLIIPTYNERENIVPLIQRIVATLEKALPSFEIILVDDDSPDKTWQVARDLARENPYLKVIRRCEEKGLAAAVVAGWKAARGEILGVMDGDLQHPPEILAQLLQTMSSTSADVVIASRHVREGGVGDWNVVRRFLSWAAAALAGFLMPTSLKDVHDPMSGYFFLRRSVLESVNLTPKGYKILLEVLAKGNHQCVLEVPYVFEERKRGKSKLRPQHSLEFISHVVQLSKKTGELRRFLRFCTVGLSGVFVNEGALWLLSSLGGLYYGYSSVIAIELAIVNNFLLNEVWTFQDRANRRPYVGARLGRFLQFNSICAFGALLNILALLSLTALLGFHYLLSNVGGISVALLWNYWLNRTVTWSTELPS
jgi:dolichol-phosphate mannosyltransferase